MRHRTQFGPTLITMESCSLSEDDGQYQCWFRTKRSAHVLILHARGLRTEST